MGSAPMTLVGQTRSSKSTKAGEGARVLDHLRLKFPRAAEFEALAIDGFAKGRLREQVVDPRLHVLEEGNDGKKEGEVFPVLELDGAA